MWLRGPEQPPSPPPGPQPGPETAAAIDEERWLLCAACGHPIASTRARRSIEGAHVHVRVNPSGIEYRFGCFDDAPGCGGWGESSTFFTWFSGYAWEIVLCRGCSIHLGWVFRSEGDVFYGLLLDRLREGSPQRQT